MLPTLREHAYTRTPIYKDKMRRTVSADVIRALDLQEDLVGRSLSDSKKRSHTHIQRVRRKTQCE